MGQFNSIRFIVLYCCGSTATRRALQREYPGITFHEVAFHLGERWRKETPYWKAHYEKEAERDRVSGTYMCMHTYEPMDGVVALSNTISVSTLRLTVGCLLATIVKLNCSVCSCFGYCCVLYEYVAAIPYRDAPVQDQATNEGIG